MFFEIINTTFGNSESGCFVAITTMTFVSLGMPIYLSHLVMVFVAFVFASARQCLMCHSETLRNSGCCVCVCVIACEIYTYMYSCTLINLAKISLDQILSINNTDRIPYLETLEAGPSLSLDTLESPLSERRPCNVFCLIGVIERGAPHVWRPRN